MSKKGFYWGTIYVLATKQMENTLIVSGCVPRKETSGLSFAESKGRKELVFTMLSSIARLVLPHHSVDNVRDFVVRQACLRKCRKAFTKSIIPLRPYLR